MGNRGAKLDHMQRLSAGKRSGRCVRGESGEQGTKGNTKRRARFLGADRANQHQSASGSGRMNRGRDLRVHIRRGAAAHTSSIGRSRTDQYGNKALVCYASFTRCSLPGLWSHLRGLLACSDCHRASRVEQSRPHRCSPNISANAFSHHARFILADAPLAAIRCRPDEPPTPRALPHPANGR